MSIYTEAVETMERLRADLAASQEQVKALEDALKWAAAVVLSAVTHHHTIKEADAAYMDADNRKTVGEILDMANQALEKS